ncbi:histidine phosphatase family protein [Verticiella sediminum]|uniref:Histidine phosphatase family protein n=1 Tax=Verticiella sediminum TaxID=1247510 RepID=A0A556B246_9BURK|nr:histidine phosphatase family protein [Verticiella sediminum]TSH99234.1 histidine phosphatase family protein [Verticiella sediminum]
MGRILLVRHGQASLMGDDYDALSEVGHAQGRLLGEWLSARGERFAHVVMGSLKRHAQTAEACLAALGEAAAAPHIDAGLDEYRHEDMVARYAPEFADRAAMKAWLARSENPRKAFQQVFAAAFDRWVSGAHDEDYPIAWSAFRARSVAALEQVAAACGSGESALVFTSGGPIAGIVQHVLGMPDDRVAGLHFPLFNGGLTQLLTRPGSVGLSYFNAIGYLEEAGRDYVTYR